jgi:alkylresorcinol/alkylpyrone synthase
VSPQARLTSIATAVPAHVLDQKSIAAEATRVFAPRFKEFDKLIQVFTSAGIGKRHAARPLEWFLEPRGWPERTEAYLEVATDLFVEAAGLALERAGIVAGDIDTVVTVSSTGIATPSLEALAAQRIGFHPGIERVPVFGLGCAGGTSGLSIAARLAESHPGSNVLLVTIELCTLAFRLDKLTKANIVATALFGDGAAACVVRAGEEGLARIEMSAQTTWPDTLDIMGWSVEPQGFGVIFDRTIPPFAREHLGAAMRGMLARNALSFSDIGRLIGVIRRLLAERDRT